jgi:hypothetical protein
VLSLFPDLKLASPSGAAHLDFDPLDMYFTVSQKMTFCAFKATLYSMQLFHG